MIKLISEGKAEFSGCPGPFAIADDLSAISDIKKINLSSLGGRLQGKHALEVVAETTTSTLILLSLQQFRPTAWGGD